MDRQRLLLTLSRYRQHALACGLTMTDDGAGFQPAIDDTLRVLGVAEADLDPSVDLSGYTLSYSDATVVLRHRALLLLAEQFALQPDVQTDTPNVRRANSQMFKALQVLIADAQKAADALGYGDSQWALGRVQLDIFEPQQSVPTAPGWFGP